MFTSYNPVSVGIPRFFARRCSSVKKRLIESSIRSQALAVKYFFMRSRHFRAKQYIRSISSIGQLLYLLFTDIKVQNLIKPLWDERFS